MEEVGNYAERLGYIIIFNNYSITIRKRRGIQIFINDIMIFADYPYSNIYWVKRWFSSSFTFEELKVVITHIEDDYKRDVLCLMNNREK